MKILLVIDKTYKKFVTRYKRICEFGGARRSRFYLVKPAVTPKVLLLV